MSAPYNHRSHAHMIALASRVRGVPADWAAVFAAVTIEKGMMRTRQLWARLLMRFLAWRLKCSVGEAWLEVFLRHPAIARDLIEQTADWIENGRDTSDPASAGGYNAEEVDGVSAMLDAVEMNA